MPTNSSQSSFIPKRGATRSKRKAPAKRIFVFSLVAYSLVFAALISSGASYLYKNYTMSLLQNEVSLLNSEISTFSISDLSVVSEFDLTLQRASNRLENTVSIVAALDAIDLVTAQPVQITSLTMDRVGDDFMQFQLEVTAQSFDSALFQRHLINADPQLFSEVSIYDVSVETTAVTESQSTVTPLTDQPVSFTVTMQMPIEFLPYGSTPSDTLGLSETTGNQTAL